MLRVELPVDRIRRRPVSRLSRLAAVLIAGLAATYAQSPGPAPGFLVSNSDAVSISTDVAVSDAVAFFSVAPAGTLTPMYSVRMDGAGGGGGDFAANRALVVSGTQDTCVFASFNARTNPSAVGPRNGAIVGISVTSQGGSVSGTFSARPSDSGVTQSGTSYGIGLAATPQYLYASYAASGTLGTFRIEPGCKLTFVDDVFTVGLANGWITGMALRGRILVVAYGDGSIESFNISGGKPVSNGDVQNSTGYADSHVPNGVDITSDGRFAIFGDVSTDTTVEVSDISSGKLSRTVHYNFPRDDPHTPAGWNSANVRLSPDESTLFISNNSSGQVTAAFFDKASGKLSLGCTSASLKNFYTTWTYAGAIGLQLPTGRGGYLYIPEFGSHLIGVVEYTYSATKCSLSEIANSPVSFITGIGASPLSVDVFPRRPF
jgi:6-phosphogluconolactonase (cycloisomerase 2 family)